MLKPWPLAKGPWPRRLSTEFGERQLRNSLNDGAVGGSCLRGGSMSINYWRAKGSRKRIRCKERLKPARIPQHKGSFIMSNKSKSDRNEGIIANVVNASAISIGERSQAIVNFGPAQAEQFHDNVTEL